MFTIIVDFIYYTAYKIYLLIEARYFIMIYDFDSRMTELKNDRVFYILLSGLSYTEISERYYHFQYYKFVYKVRKLFKEFNLHNRRQLAFFAVSNGLVEPERIGEY